MAFSNQIAAYADCFDKLDDAIERINSGKRGIRILFPNWNAAKTFQQRANKARKLDREQNSKIYEANDPKHGNSPYDILIIRNPREAAEGDGTFWVYLEPQRQEFLEIEDIEVDDPLPEWTGKPLIEHQPQLQLPSPVNETSTPDRTASESPPRGTGPQGPDEQSKSPGDPTRQPQKMDRRV